MDKLFIFMTILSLIITILYYFGIVRYLELHIRENKKYLENYKKLEKNYDKKVIISMSSTPKNIDKMDPMLNSLLDQTVKAFLYQN